jgi:hypothetical protein
LQIGLLAREKNPRGQCALIEKQLCLGGCLSVDEQDDGQTNGKSNAQ